MVKAICTATPPFVIEVMGWLFSSSPAPITTSIPDVLVNFLGSNSHSVKSALALQPISLITFLDIRDLLPLTFSTKGAAAVQKSPFRGAGWWWWIVSGPLPICCWAATACQPGHNRDSPEIGGDAITNEIDSFNHKLWIWWASPSILGVPIHQHRARGSQKSPRALQEK